MPDFIKIAIVFWLIIGFLYLEHTPPNHRSHDFIGHVHNTKIIINEKRLPKPYDLAVPGGETFQPPLYYLICSLVSPGKINTDENAHVNAVRILSLLFGAIAIYFIGRMLNSFSTSESKNLLILAFLASTPKFAFVFSTYNNDVLATVLGIAITVLSYELFKNWSNKKGILLFILSTAALYTKFTLFLCIFTIMFFCLISILLKKQFKINEGKIIIVLISSLIALSPWIIFHNYKLTGKLFPNNAEDHIQAVNCNSFKKLVGMVFRIGTLIEGKPSYSHEWDKPWVYPTWQDSPPETKRYDYLGYIFITSIIGEYVLSSPNEKFIWFILFINCIVGLFSIYCAFKNKESKIALAFIGLILLENLFLLAPFDSSLKPDYRYMAWLWVPWSVLFMNSLNNANGFLKQLLFSCFILGIIINIYILKTIEGGFWW